MYEESIYSITIVAAGKFKTALSTTNDHAIIIKIYHHFITEIMKLASCRCLSLGAK